MADGLIDMNFLDEDGIDSASAVADHDQFFGWLGVITFLLALGGWGFRISEGDVDWIHP